MSPLPQPRQITAGSGLFIVFLIAIVLSCSSDDDIDASKKCLPLNLRTSTWSIFDSVVYEYNTLKKLDRILLYNNNTLIQINQLSYDGDNKLIRYTQTFTDAAAPFEIYDIIYNSDGKPAYTQVSEPIMLIPPSVITYTYNDRGRLIFKEDSRTQYVWHYQYDDQDNVIKVFYQNALTSGEVLGRENHTFDTQPTFYANSPELTTLSIYILGYEPSKNNVTTSTIYWGNPGYQEAMPRRISHIMSYDANGLPSASVNNDGSVEGEFYFQNVTYGCQ